MAGVRECPLSDGVAGPFQAQAPSYVPRTRALGGRTQSRRVRAVVFSPGRPSFTTGGLAEPLRLENPGQDRARRLGSPTLVYEVCTG
jgi:hypothetical protein